MKKLLFVLPIIGLLFFISCDKDESEEVIEETIAFDQIEVIEEKNTKAFTAVLTSGIYGSCYINSLDSEKYYYVLSQEALNTIPKNNRKYRLYIDIETSNSSDGYWNIGTFELSTNVVRLSFPTSLDNFGGFPNITGKNIKWRLRYQVYQPSTSPQIHFTEEKIINVNH